jgi:putative ABC transport system substrate-binding protein
VACPFRERRGDRLGSRTVARQRGRRGSFGRGGWRVRLGFDQADNFRRAASYVDLILRGEKSGNLPVQLPTKFEMVVNLKTAKALGLTVPPSILLRADEVTE